MCKIAITPRGEVRGGRGKAAQTLFETARTKHRWKHSASDSSVHRLCHTFGEYSPITRGMLTMVDDIYIIDLLNQTQVIRKRGQERLSALYCERWPCSCAL